jgi:hypothetical protein
MLPSSYNLVNFKSLALTSVLFFGLLQIGCNRKPLQPTSQVKAVVKYESEIMVDVKVDVYQKGENAWKLLLTGVSSNTQPIHLFPIDASKSLPAAGDFRITLESIGAMVLPIKPAFRDPAKTPLVWKGPLLQADVQVIELPKDAIAIRYPIIQGFKAK